MIKTSRLISCFAALLVSHSLYAGDAITVSAISNPITIAYDEEDIPHIQGDNLTENDIAFAQGYAQAAQRFFEMDVTRRFASGTMTELVGEAALADDIQVRTLGLRRGAWETWVAMNNEGRAWLKAYTDGVNTWLNNQPLPPEYGALELTRATPWTPVDSLVVAKALAFQLSFDLDIDLTILVGAYQTVGQIAGIDGSALFFEDVFRSAPPDDRVSIPGFLSDIGGAGKTADTDIPEKLSVVSPLAVELAKNYQGKIKHNPFLSKSLTQDKEGAGSNWWVVDGEHTASGQPILSNDPHLGLGYPSVFMEVYLPDAAGVSVPGAPGIIQGCTQSYCWGSTWHPMDVTDVYMETLETNNFGLPTHTVYQGVKEPVIWIYQSYFANQLDGTADNLERVKVGYDAGGITFIVPRRNNGPLVSVNIEDKVGLSVQYTGWGPTFELEAFRKMNTGSTLEDFKAALQLFDVGSQNFSYADTAGNIAYFTSAEMPLREDMQTMNTVDGGIPPFLIRDGSGALKHEWMPVQNPQPGQVLPYEILPFDEMPQVVNPAAGYIANANNDPVGLTLDNNPLNQLRPGGGLYYLYYAYSSFRIGRIDRVLQDAVSKADVDVEQMQALQANNQLLDAELVLPHVFKAYENALKENAWPGLQQFLLDDRMIEAMSLLQDWDYSTPTGIPEGFDPGDDPENLPEPSSEEVASSVSSTIFAVWRGQMLANTIDGTLNAMGLTDYLPSERAAYNALKHHLDTFETAQGVGASGVPFFNVPDAPTAQDARDFLVLYSLQQGLDLLASDEMAPAFGNSTDLSDYRWGKLHRIVFAHPLGAPLSVPNYGPFTDLSPEMPGLATAGGYEAVDASLHSARADGLNEFMYSAGPARRFVGELFEGDIQGYEIIPGGQSGDITSPFYASQLGRWLTNHYHRLTPSQGPAVVSRTVELVPAP